MNERGNKRDIVKILSKNRTETSKIIKRMFQILVFYQYTWDVSYLLFKFKKKI